MKLGKFLHVSGWKFQSASAFLVLSFVLTPTANAIGTCTQPQSGGPYVCTITLSANGVILKSSAYYPTNSQPYRAYTMYLYDTCSTRPNGGCSNEDVITYYEYYPSSASASSVPQVALDSLQDLQSLTKFNFANSLSNIVLTCTKDPAAGGGDLRFYFLSSNGSNSNCSLTSVNSTP